MMLSLFLALAAPPMVVVREEDVKREEPPPHGNIGMSTAYRISDAVPAPRAMEFRKRILHRGAAIGLHPIQYAAIFCVNLAVGSLTPPYASLLYLGMRIGKVEFMDILPPLGIFLLAYVPVMLLTTYWPALSLTLPRMMGFL